MQQSDPDGYSDPQLSVPQTRYPMHWLSLSQSPSPIPHGFSTVQHDQSWLDHVAGLHSGLPMENTYHPMR